MQHPNCLMSRILRARYFPDGNILTATLKRKASYAWRSILHGRDLITKGLTFIVGDGSTTNMWTDPWIPDHPPRPPRPCSKGIQDEKANTYFNAMGSDWNEERLRQFVVPEDVDRILALKISSKAVNDLVGWHYNDEIYTVKSGYWLGTHLPDNNNPEPIPGDPQLKHKIWRTKLPAKIKHFLWRILSKGLATGSNLKRRHVIQDDQCRRCCQAEETKDHLFFDCDYAKRIWRASGFMNLAVMGQQATIEEKIEACLSSCSSIRLAHFQELHIWILWRLWKSRNVLVFQQKQLNWKSVMNMHVMMLLSGNRQEQDK